MSNEKVLMALSGGVDSSVAAILLKGQGYELIGITLRVYQSRFRSDPLGQSINDATILADKLDIPYYVIDVHEDFEDTVIHDFVDEYQSGRTPNPCALCNYQIKWKYLIKLADEFACKYIATGHYAQVKELNGRHFISKGRDGIKDQSYFLWRLSQDYLKRTIFPLGEYSKMEIKKIADRLGFKKLATKKESYDLCFIPEGNYREFLQQNQAAKKEQKGYFISSSGNVLGEHSGVQNYTIGQRKDMGIAQKEPLYVVKIDAVSNTVVLGGFNALGESVFYLESYRLNKYEKLPVNIVIQTKIRYKSPEIDCRISFVEDKLKVELDEPVLAVTPGQSAVFYEGDDLIGGGVIV